MKTLADQMALKSGAAFFHSKQLKMNDSLSFGLLESKDSARERVEDESVCGQQCSSFIRASLYNALTKSLA